MATTTLVLVQAQIDSVINEQAQAVFEQLGITTSDALALLLTRTAQEGVLALPAEQDLLKHDVWFRAKVQEALDDPRPYVAHDVVEAHFAERRAASSRS